MPYDFSLTPSTPSRSFQANEARPTTSAAASTSSSMLSEPLSNIPQRQGSDARSSIGDGQGSALSAKRKRHSNKEVAERIDAYSKTAVSDGAAKSNGASSQKRDGHYIRTFLSANGAPTLKGRQLRAAANGHVFCPVNAPALMLWIDKDNHMPMQDFAERFNLYLASLANYARANHTLTPKGEYVLLRDQGHQFVHPTSLHIEQFQKLCALPESKTSIAEYCREMNLSVSEFVIVMHADGTPTEKGERRIAAAAAQKMNAAPSTSSGGKDSIDRVGSQSDKW